MNNTNTVFCLDLGNTNYKMAIFENGHMKRTEALGKKTIRQDLGGLIEDHAPKRSIISSVVALPEGLLELLEETSSTYVLSPELRLPFLNAYATPYTLGQDRLAMAAALHAQYPQEASLAISIGTCLTYNFLSAQGIFRGGGISPGIHMRFNALHEDTALLPKVEKAAFPKLLGYDTSSSISSGVIQGIAAEIDGIIEKYTDQFGKINAVLTGGDASYFERHLKSKIFVDQFFTFKGLYAILQSQK